MTTLTNGELAERLSQFVWEHVADFMDEGSVALQEGAAQDAIEGMRVDIDEVLIFFLWIHTRVVQKAFADRYPAETVKQVLDSMHRGVFSDIESQGIPARRLPLFEQLMSARYAEYYAAAKGEDSEIGLTAARRIERPTDGARPAALAAALTQAAVDVSHPLSDFLAEIQLAQDTALVG